MVSRGDPRRHPSAQDEGCPCSCRQLTRLQARREAVANASWKNLMLANLTAPCVMAVLAVATATEEGLHLLVLTVAGVLGFGLAVVNLFAPALPEAASPRGRSGRSVQR